MEVYIVLRSTSYRINLFHFELHRYTHVHLSSTRLISSRSSHPRAAAPPRSPFPFPVLHIPAFLDLSLTVLIFCCLHGTPLHTVGQRLQRIIEYGIRTRGSLVIQQLFRRFRAVKERRTRRERMTRLLAPGLHAIGKALAAIEIKMEDASGETGRRSTSAAGGAVRAVLHDVYGWVLL